MGLPVQLSTVMAAPASDTSSGASTSGCDRRTGGTTPASATGAVNNPRKPALKPPGSLFTGSPCDAQYEQPGSHGR